MSTTKFSGGVLTGLLLTFAAATTAHAQDTVPPPTSPTMFFAEVTGSYGVQFGETDYLPAGTPGDYQYPLVHGLTFGGAAGVMLAPNIALVGVYDYTWATTPIGGVTGVLDRVQGTVDYHTAALGLRVYLPLDVGRIRAEMALGVLFPFHTQLELQYGPALGQLPTPIMGSGTMINDYSVGFGGHAALGYEIPITQNFYVDLNLRYRLYETENSGERTTLTNFVTDFGAVPPTAVTAVIPYGDGMATPHAYSVQDVRLQLGFGGGF